MWLRSVFVMTVRTAQTTSNLIFLILIWATSICGPKTDTGQMFCNASSVSCDFKDSKILHTWIYQYRCNIVSECGVEVNHHKCLKTILSFFASSYLFFFLHCLCINSLASRADHTINKHVTSFYLFNGVSSGPWSIHARIWYWPQLKQQCEQLYKNIGSGQ